MNANGNIESLAKNGNLGAGNEPMDRLTYAYKPGTNQLTSVSDEVPAPRYDNDIDSQNGDNYDYDEIGNLTADAQGEIENIEWTVRGKIKKITRTEESTQPQLEFDYGPMGNRVESPGSVAWECNSKAASWELLTDTGGRQRGYRSVAIPQLDCVGMCRKGLGYDNSLEAGTTELNALIRENFAK